MKRMFVSGFVVLAAVVGVAALSSGTEAQAARPCPGSTLPCLEPAGF